MTLKNAADLTPEERRKVMPSTARELTDKGCVIRALKEVFGVNALRVVENGWVYEWRRGK